MKSLLTVLKLKLKNLFKSGEAESEMDREMRFHLESVIEQNIQNGMSPQEARQAAAREFGSVERYKEDCRDSWGVRVIQDLLQDVRYSLRQLRKAPGFATIAILTVAIGIGACTALFSVFNAVLLKPLNYEESHRIGRITETKLPDNSSLRPTVGFYFDLLEQSTVFENLSGRRYQSVALTYGDRYRQTSQNIITPNYFEVYKLSPLLGRLFRADEGAAGKNNVAILSYEMWQSQFGGRADILEQQIQLDEQTHTIIGIIDDPEYQWSSIFTPSDFATERRNYDDSGIGLHVRIKPDVTHKEIQAELGLISSRLALERPQTNQNRGATFTTLLERRSWRMRSQLFILLSAVGFLLLIACVNVASLLLARASVRQRELALRGALGASRGRLIRQLLCESVIISFIGGALGTLFAYASMGPLTTFASHFVSRARSGISVDGTVLGVTFGLMLLAGLVIGLIPALQATKTAVVGALNESGRSSTGSGQQQRMRGALIVTEIALALMLLTGTGLLVRSLYAMQTFDQGLSGHNVSGAQFDLVPQSRYDTSEKIINFTNLALERVNAVPDVVTVAMTTAIPMGWRNGVHSRVFSLNGDTNIPLAERLSADFYKITPGYHDIMSIPLIRGRTITAQDVPGSPPVVVINTEMAQRHFQHQDPIGQRIMILPGSDEPGVWHEIVGIVGNVKPHGPISPTNPQFYTPLSQNPQGHLTLMLRTKGPSPALSQTVSDIIHSIDVNIDFPRVYNYEDTIASSWSRQRFTMILFGIFSGLALLLSAIGIYGVTAYTVNQRTHEIGIRMALGALPRDVMNLILRGGARIIILGVLLGAAGSLAGARVFESFLFNTSPYDPVTFISIAVILTMVALFACFIPARRATKIDPMIAMGNE